MRMSSRMFGAALAAGSLDIPFTGDGVTAADRAQEMESYELLIEQMEDQMLAQQRVQDSKRNGVDLLRNEFLRRVRPGQEAGLSDSFVEQLRQRFGFFIDEADLETPLERWVRQAHESVAAADKFDAVLVELREANRLARRSWWARLWGAR